MKWFEVEVTANPEWQDILTQIFMDYGIQGIEIVDPGDFRDVLSRNRYLDYADDGFINSFGDNIIVRAYFNDGINTCILEDDLTKAFAEYNINPTPVIKIRLRDDSEWKDNWKNNYTTFPISKRVYIKPSWESFNPPEGKIVIELDPGMAFGTGTHETTRMCALFLDDMVRGGEYVLDLGCGTGILGIIAAKLGAMDITCVDIDETACRTAEENIKNNRAEGSVRVIKGELKDVEYKKYDIIIINIITDVILSLLPGLNKYCCPESCIILSGIIKERKQEVLDAVKFYGFHPVQELNDGEWVAMRICTGS